MKIGILNTSGEGAAVFEKLRNSEHCMGVQEGVQAVFLDNLGTMLEGLQGKVIINGSIGAQNLSLNKQIRGRLLEAIKIPGTPGFCSVFTLFNGEDFSDFLETSFSTRFMNKEVGPNVGFTLGTGYRVGLNIFEAIPQLETLRQALQGIHYRGELLFEIAEDYTITNFHLGHFYGHWGMFCEGAKVDSNTIMEFLLGNLDTCPLHDSVIMSNLVTQQPFPARIPVQITQRLTAPTGAEKHLWRIFRQNGECLLITVHGISVKECQKRIWRTLDNLTEYNKELQYRTDFGIRHKFLFSLGRYLEPSFGQELAK